MKLRKTYTTAYLLIVSLGVIFACSNPYYKSNAVDADAYPTVLNNLTKNHQFSIMQSGQNFYIIKSVEVEQARKEFTVTLDRLDSARLRKISNPDLKRLKTESLSGAGGSELHLHLKDSTTYTLDEPHTIPIANIARVEILK